MAKRGTRGQGFSLYGLQTEISQAVDLLTEALERQGVAVNPDALLLRFQNVINDVGNGVSALEPTAPSYSYLQASDNEEIPYSVAGDLLAIAYEKFKIGDKKEAVKNVISAMSYDDFGDITTGLLAMNAKSSEITASDEDTDESDDFEDEDEDNDDEDEDNDDLDDDDIDALLEEDENEETTASDDDEDDKSDDDDEDKNKDKDKKPTEEVKPAPKKSPMSEETPITASLAQRCISNKLSMNGDAAGRGKGKEFLKRAGATKAA